MTTLSSRLTIEKHNNKEIIIADFSGLKEKDMIELDILHLQLTLETKLSFVADFRNSYVTGDYVKQGREFIEMTRNIIDKGAFLGIDTVKSFILKGIRLEYGVNYQAFETKEEAIKFLTEDGP